MGKIITGRFIFTKQITDTGYEILDHMGTVKIRQEKSIVGGVWDRAEIEETANAALLEKNAYLLNTAQSKIIDAVKRAYEFAVNKPYIDEQGIEWDSGFNSVTALMAVQDLARACNATEMTIDDSNDIERTFKITKKVGYINLINDLNAHVQGLRKRKSSLYNEIREITDIDELNKYHLEKLF